MLKALQVQALKSLESSGKESSIKFLFLEECSILEYEWTKDLNDNNKKLTEKKSMTCYPKLLELSKIQNRKKVLEMLLRMS